MTEIVYEILIFAALRERMGASSIAVRAPATCTVAELLAAAAAQHPRIATVLPACRVAAAQEFVAADAIVPHDGEIAFIPPVSGGHDGVPPLLLTHAPLRTGDVIDAVAGPEMGAVSSFCGYVRRHSRGRVVQYLEYEAYEAMALASMRSIAARVTDEVASTRLAIHHRLGRLELGECAVVIAAAAPHRAPAFAACRLAIEALKREVPIWKREIAEDGAVWIGLGP
ncbi:MAG: molybdenum cofactor biosynthesis protein MoaE [Deltaproteobacteria bacterium]|nr:molybdenum cofactor biosynthesis protein MoaE [Deltaproteobacteria bacterium]MBK8236953.1 molybdenum cofactor biosynthesis protein MoaE [Deltaproteobacteria bacterium]MBK8719161.1 molybdenum cofactor biosynthesis protein MoaE [Deltaproteobacteria bacterium]MBP7289797.1 molybdenum cofactor biosynthesis protein MoaE [Nannocystaceae bacterium]